MTRRVPLWSVALALLLLAGLTVAQGFQPNFIRNLVGPIAVTGDLSVAGTITSTGVISATAANIKTTGRYCTDVACTTNYLKNDTFGSLNIAGPASFTNNISAAGTVQASGYVIASGGLKNTGTAAPCSGSTGAVCIDDPGGLAIADGAGTTYATITELGQAAFTSLTVGGINTAPPFDAPLSSTSLALTGTPVVQEFGAMATAGTITAASFTPGVIGVGAGSYVAKLCSDSACAAITYVTCTVACTGAVGTPVACTINTAAVAGAADPFFKITTACAPSPQGMFTAHLKQP